MAAWILATAAIVAAAVAVFVTRRSARRTLNRLNEMLDAAIQGRFSETKFDESLLSAVESRFHRYLKSSETSARRREADRERLCGLVSDVTHQTRTPVANVLLYTQLLRERELPEDCAACASALEGQARKLQVLMDSLVKLSRLETGIIALEPRRARADGLMRAAVSQNLPRAEARRIALECAPTEAEACFDPRWTEEALCNLIDNAIKYAPGGSRVRLRAEAYEFFLRIDVADEGPGVPEAEQPRLFERFYRGAAARDAEGVGVGLCLARQIVAGQGGYIKLASAPGQGSVFSLFLPIA